MLDNGWLIVCGVVFFVIVFNLGLALSLLRNRGIQKAYLSGSISDLLNPWKKEDKDLEELRRQAKNLDEHSENLPDEAADG